MVNLILDEQSEYDAVTEVGVDSVAALVDLSTVAPGTTEKEALADSIDGVRHAEALGFHRVWFAQHHLGRSGATHYPQLLIAAASAVTSHIRLGSGAMLMNNHSPFTLAEMFKQLEAMAPGRVDLGIGRAGGLRALDLAIQQNREHPAAADHQQQVLEVLAWLYNRFPEKHPFADLGPVLASVPEIPQTWLLGSSPSSSELAGALGMGYTFAGFINPAASSSALHRYRQSFRPQGFGLEAPRTILAVNVTVGDTEAEGLRLVNSVKGFYARLSNGKQHPIEVTVPSAEQGARELDPTQAAEPTSIAGGRWPRFIAGGPTQVRATLEQMVEESGADELMIQNAIADPADRKRSHELLAEMFDLTPHHAHPVEASA